MHNVPILMLAPELGHWRNSGGLIEYPLSTEAV
jgi:hypothetical protein